MTRRLDVQSRHREQIERLLREHLPAVEVWAYGSRVNGQSHAGSDLDLVLRSPGLVEIDSSQLAEFNEAVQESTIPFLIEARDWARLPESFQREIEREYVVLVGGEEQRVGGEWQEAKEVNSSLLHIPIGVGSIPVKWCWSRLEDICDGIFDCPHSTPKLSDSGPLVVRTQDILSGVFRAAQAGHVSEETYRERTKRAEPTQGDLLYSREGTYFGIAAEVPQNYQICLGQRMVLLRPNSQTVNFRYLRFWLNSPMMESHIHGFRDGSVAERLNLPTIRTLPVLLPPLPEQRAIAHILGALDDKIELNRRMNETLEEMARALFKSWFIDFDPVHAKAALKRPSPPLITPPLRGSRQAKGDSPQARRWGVVRRSYTQHAQQKARSLRENQTDAEGLLWHYLRHKQLDGHKFRRQQPIGPYIVDFACMPRKVIVELDGGQHAERRNHDERRDRFLQGQGYRLLRFWNNEVFENCFGVLERIYEAVQNPPPPQPAPGGLASATPPQGGSDRTGKKAWTVERARAYLDRMDPSIAALFPDCFVDSELGEVPEGWGVGTLDDMLELLSGGTPKTSVAEYWDGDIPWYTAKDAPPPSDVFVVETERKITQAGIENSAAKILPAGTTIITARGTVGRLACLGMPMTMNQTCYGIRGVPGYPDFFTYMNIKMTVNELQQRTHGTIFDTITRQTFKLIDAIIPPPKLADKFETVVQPIMGHILSNLCESRALTALRDTLLPKLVSGELRVKTQKQHD